jgi:soluble lytic murein transglycosylase
MRTLPLSLLLALCLVSPTAGAADLGAQRAVFPEALRAAKRGNVDIVARHRELLADYPLYPYLDHYLLANTFDRAGPDAVTAFIEHWPDLPTNARLRHDWLRVLAHHQRWSLFVREWNDSRDTTLRCHWVTARLRTGGGDDPAVLEAATELWLSGRSQPDACDPVFAWLADANHLTDGLIQQRMELALEARQYGLAGWLARRLDEADRDFVRRWRNMQAGPTRALADRSLRADSARERRLVLAGLERLIRIDPERGREELARLSTQFSFDPQERIALQRAAAVLAAQRHMPAAVAWLDELDGGDVVVDEWRVRAALRAADWVATGHALDGLSEELQNQPVWQYWRARTDEAQGRTAPARDRYEELATDTGYHSWLAADRIGQLYRIQSEDIVENPAAIARLEAIPGILRAREFRALGMHAEARSEWINAVAGMGDDELVQAALLAQRWGWHTQAIATVNRARRYGHLDLRYPVLFAQQIIPRAQERGLDPALVYSLVRSESLFVPDARSVAGALGLMQLMPGTGREVARRIGVRLSGNAALLDPDTNIRLGSAYLGTVMDRFDRQEVVATAAYNAGPSRVQRWLPQDETLPADVWVETIPFNETRAYVRQVMGGTAIFDWRLGRTIRPLSTRMNDIPAKAD